MADTNSHISYTVEDIERYLNGGMSSKEMHAMEKAALQDPFLADAIEGFSEATMLQSHQHLNEITALLQKDKEEAKVVTMPMKSFQWWRVAAMIIVVAGVGLFSWYLIGMNKPSTTVNEATALNEKIAPIVKDSNSNSVQRDTANNFIAQQSTTQQLASANAESKEMKDAEKRIAFNRRAEKEDVAVLKNTDAYTATTIDTVHFNFKTAPGLQISKAKPDSVSENTFTSLQGRVAGVSMMNKNAMNRFSGIVLDNNKQPVPGALVNLNNKRVAITDNKGYFQTYAPDSSLQVSVSSVGYETAKANLATGFANKITLAPSTQSLSEVVVTGYGAKKKAQAKSEALSNASDTSFPSGGWESFQQYVYSKMNIPYDTANNDLVMHGVVEIEFSIDEEGNPYNFKIVKSMGKENDEKAVNAIKNGPRWITSKKNKKGKVVINF
jgi:hypothetical protein